MKCSIWVATPLADEYVFFSEFFSLVIMLCLVNLCFADDTAVFVKRKTKLEDIDWILQNIHSIGKGRKETKVTVRSRNNQQDNQYNIGKREIKQIHEICFLDSTVTEGGRSKGTQ